jgi:hypothetical protein
VAQDAVFKTLRQPQRALPHGSSAPVLPRPAAAAAASATSNDSSSAAVVGAAAVVEEEIVSPVEFPPYLDILQPRHALRREQV